MLPRDKPVLELGGEVRLSQTGEMISHMVAEKNKNFLEISGLTPGEDLLVAR